MGAKGLKAISVVGSGQREPGTTGDRSARSQGPSSALRSRTAERPAQFLGDIKELEAIDAAMASGRAVLPSPAPKADHALRRLLSGTCPVRHRPQVERELGSVLGTMLRGALTLMPACRTIGYDWQLARRAAFELNVLSNRYGLNQFDLIMGMVPWLIACQKAGLINEI